MEWEKIVSLWFMNLIFPILLFIQEYIESLIISCFYTFELHYASKLNLSWFATKILPK